MSPCLHVQLTSFKFIYLIVCNCALKYTQIILLFIFTSPHSKFNQCEQFFATCNHSSAIFFFSLGLVHRESVIFWGFNAS